MANPILMYWFVKELTKGEDTGKDIFSGDSSLPPLWAMVMVLAILAGFLGAIILAALGVFR